jgi:hypothetical protein
MIAKTSGLTRAAAALSLAGLVAASAGAASAQPYRQPTGGGLGSVVSCDAPGGRQAAGAVIGALLGAALGSNLAKHDRGTGTAIGALAGAAGGSYLGCQQQRQRADAQAYGYGGYAPPARQAAYDRPYDRSYAGDFVAVSTVNVRAAPSTAAPRIGSIGAGEGFRAVGRDGDWIVVGQGGGLGYVYGGYVQPAERYQQASYRY